jgi:hypothetical protein
MFIEAYKGITVNNTTLSQYIKNYIDDIPFCNLNEMINNADTYENQSPETIEKMKNAFMSISIQELSKEGLEQSLRFNPSYLYLLLEYVYTIIAKRVYIPRSQEFLSQYSISIFNDPKVQLTKIDSLIKFDETYIGVIATIIASVLAFFGASIMAIDQIPLLLKGAIVLYLSLNFFMNMLFCLRMRMGE